MKRREHGRQRVSLDLELAVDAAFNARLPDGSLPSMRAGRSHYAAAVKAALLSLGITLEDLG